MRIRGETGSTIVEMALILPLFLLLVFGIFEFGRAWLIINTMNHAAREAVRRASVTPLDTAEAEAKSRVKAILDAAHIDIDEEEGVDYTYTAATAGPPPTPAQVTVSIDLDYTWMTGIGPLLGFSFAGTIPLSSSATMRYEL